MKKLLPTSIASLFLATGVAHAWNVVDKMADDSYVQWSAPFAVDR
jgi:hypothetical protein